MTSLVSAREREFLDAVSRLTWCNTFGPERLTLEQQALGDDFTPFDVVWHSGADAEGGNPNVARIAARAEELAQSLRGRLTSRSPRETAALYRDLAMYLLYGRYQDRFFAIIRDPKAGERRAAFGFYRDFLDDFSRLMPLPGTRVEEDLDPAHLFACFFQIRRAFHFTFRSIVGGSMPAARLRAQVWQSVFTHDLKRYLLSLYRTLGDVTTLVTGPSGTGKELARSIGYSRYIPFDPEAGVFRESWAESFFALNLSALSPTLIESELFGHRRGAFTGAVADHAGWLEVCPPLGTVFLDEIGEVEPAIQVKLLRVLETRMFQRLGESRPRRFQGKVVAATNRDLAAEMRAGRFRDDLYYRICSDMLVTPSGPSGSTHRARGPGRGGCDLDGGPLRPAERGAPSAGGGGAEEILAGGIRGHGGGGEKRALLYIGRLLPPPRPGPADPPGHRGAVRAAPGVGSAGGEWVTSSLDTGT